VEIQLTADFSDSLSHPLEPVVIASLGRSRIETFTIVAQPGFAAICGFLQQKVQLGRTGVTNRVENAFTQSEIQLSLDGRGQFVGIDGASEIELEAGASAENIQLLFQSSFQGTGLEILQALIFREQVSDFGNRLVDIFFDGTKLVLERAPVMRKTAAATLSPHPDARQQLQHAVVQLPRDSLPFLDDRVPNFVVSFRRFFSHGPARPVADEPNRLSVEMIRKIS
jgi:hypothetical protein